MGPPSAPEARVSWGGILAQLKVETSASHQRLETHVDLPSQLRSIECYRSMIERLFGFYVVWEPHIEAALGEHPVLRGRRKAHHLISDLRVLEVREPEIGLLPRCSPLPPLRTLAEAFGALYVIEGATLGGAIIAKQVNQKLGLSADQGCRFLSCYGDEIGPMWKQFGDHVEALDWSDETDRISCVMAAQDTFAVLNRWL